MNAEKLKELRELVAAIDARFVSGNEIPVERAHIKADEWKLLRKSSAPALLDEVEAMRADAERYRWLRDDPPLTLCVRRFPGETPRGCYLDGRPLDDAIDEALRLLNESGYHDAASNLDEALAARHEPKDAE